jgi:hypothetical protein
MVASTVTPQIRSTYFVQGRLVLYIRGTDQPHWLLKIK